MARRVPVVLELLAGQYLAQARLVEQRTAAIDREMDQLDRSIDRVDRDMAQMAATATVAARRVDNLGDQARQSATSLTALDARIKATRLSVRNLGEEWARSGSKADQVAFMAEKRALAALERLRSTLVPDAGGSRIYRSSNALSPARPVRPVQAASLGGGDGLTNPYVIAAAATIAVTTAPAVGAVVGGILAGAIGTVGVAGGLLMAAKSPQVQAAAKDLWDSVQQEFFRGGNAFVAPAIESMDLLKEAFINLHLPETFAKMAPEVITIADGFADLALNTMPGLNKAFDRMGPFAQVAATGLGDMGDALSDFLDNVTASPGAIEGLQFAFNFLNQAIIGTGRLIHFLSDTFDVFINVVRNTAHLGAIIPGPLQGFFKRIEEDAARLQATVLASGEGASTAAHGFGVFGEAVDKATIETQEFNNALSETYSAFLDSMGAAVNAEQAIDDLADSLQKNGLQFDIDTQAGRDNVRALEDLARASLDATKKKLSETGSVDEANAAYEHYRQALFDAAIQAGATAEEAQALVDKWLALQQLQNIEKTFTINQVVHRITTGESNSTFGGGFQEFSGGGTVLGPPGSPQLVIAHAGEKVLTPQQQAQQWGGTTIWGGSDRTITVIVKDTSGRTLRTELITEAANRNVDQSTIRVAYP